MSYETFKRVVPNISQAFPKSRTFPKLGLPGEYYPHSKAKQKWEENHRSVSL
jgi:hypothetical protein